MLISRDELTEILCTIDEIEREVMAIDVDSPLGQEKLTECAALLNQINHQLKSSYTQTRRCEIGVSLVG